MVFLRNALLSLALATSTVYADKLKVAFSAGAFSTISGSGTGSESGHYSSFAIINDDGTAIYDHGSPDDHSPCYNTGGGRTFTIEGDCWATPRQFHCEADFGGFPKSCSVMDADGNVLGEGEGKTDTTFIGISIGQDGTCVVEFDSDDSGTPCPQDDGNGPLHVTSG